MEIFLLLIFLSVSLFSLNQERSITLYKDKYAKESKRALIIGNSEYRYFSPLKNPVNDTEVIVKELRKRGFQVSYVANASKKEFKKAVTLFASHISREKGVGLFYFAGHRIEVEGKNYLIPVDAEIKGKEEVEFYSFPIDLLVKKMEKAQNRLNIVILDACRHDPFSRSQMGGLAPINSTKGMYVALFYRTGKYCTRRKRGVFSFCKTFSQKYQSTLYT